MVASEQWNLRCDICHFPVWPLTITKTFHVTFVFCCWVDGHRRPWEHTEWLTRLVTEDLYLSSSIISEPLRNKNSWTPTHTYSIRSSWYRSTVCFSEPLWWFWYIFKVWVQQLLKMSAEQQELKSLNEWETTNQFLLAPSGWIMIQQEIIIHYAKMLQVWWWLVRKLA